MFGDLGEPHKGSRIALVGQVESWIEQGTVLRCVGSNARVLVNSNFACGIWTLYDYVIQGMVDGMCQICEDQYSCAFPEPALNATGFKHAVDLCCGIGGMSVAAVRLGWQTKVFVDHSSLACQVVASNKGHVICGKVEDPLVQKQVHEAIAGLRPVVMAGFPCQPYSVLGSGKGLMDQRGQTLKSILRIAWLCRAGAVVLECVSEVAQYQDTMNLLNHFAETMHFQMHTVTLELADQWPARRRRWWCVMLPSGYDFSLCNWSKDTRFTCIEDVLPTWPSWPLSEEQDLQKDKYSNPSFGSDPRRLDTRGLMPTALHSWGCALRPCPCGCRLHPFAEDRLRSQGLRGFGIWSSTLQDIRFAHPKEVGYLNTLPVSLVLPDPPRAALCLVGQLAAPMQALWVLAQVQCWAQTTFEGRALTVPANCIEELKVELLSSGVGSAPPAKASMTGSSFVGICSPAPSLAPVSEAASALTDAPTPLGVHSPAPCRMLGPRTAAAGQAPNSKATTCAKSASPACASPTCPSLLSPEPLPASVSATSKARFDASTPIGVPSPEPAPAVEILTPQPGIKLLADAVPTVLKEELPQPSGFLSPKDDPCHLRPNSPSLVRVSSPEPRKLLADQDLEAHMSRKVSISTREGGYQIQLSTTTTVAELRAAESKLHGPGVMVKVRRHSHDLPDSEVLEIFNKEASEVEVRPKKQARTATGIKLLVLVAEGLKVCTGQVGETVLEVLHREGFQSAWPLLDLATQSPVTASEILKKPLAIDARPAAPAPQEGMPDTFVWVALRRLCIRSKQDQVRILPPSVAALLLECHPSTMSQCQDPLGPSEIGTKLMTVFAHANHWSLLVLEVLPSHQIRAQLFDGIPGRNFHAAEKLAARIGQVWNMLVPQIEVFSWFPQVDAHCCGAIALLHASKYLLGSSVPPWQLVSELEDIACLSRLLPRAWASGGLSQEQEQAFKAILAERRVNPQQVQERATAAISKVGAQAIAKALAHKNPWPALKVAASQPGAAFKYVTAEELEAQIEKRATQRFGSAVKAGKAKKQGKPAKKPPANLHVDPAHLQMTPGSFVAAGGGALAQIDFNEVQAHSTGLAFCTAAQMQPFIANFRTMSVDSLAIVSTAVIPEEALAGLPASNIRYPAHYSPTSEPILLRGTLLQLGDEGVELAKQDITELEPLQTISFRISAYRDEVGFDWNEFIKSPVKCIFHAFPCFSLCEDGSCPGDCPRFHRAVDEPLEQLVLDVWARQWCKLEGGKTSSEDAAVFHALIRVPASSVKHFQTAQTLGLYLEPRSSDGFAAHSGFAVIWLPNADKAAAQHALRTCEKALCLARLGKKWGLRVRECDEESVHAAFRPGIPYVKVRIQFKWKLHPLPVGFQRHQLAALLKRWQWTARPLQPLKSDSAGASWLVGSENEPPSDALPVGDSYALITLQKGLPQGPAQVPLCASRKTKRHIIYDDGEAGPSETDPWTTGPDPWSRAASSVRPPPGLPPPSQASTATGTKLARLREELQADVEEKVQSECHKHGQATFKDFAASQEDRFRKLEVSVSELRMQSEKFEGWFSSFGKQVSENSSQIKAVNGKIAQQQSQLTQVHSEVSRTAEVVNQSVQAAVGALGTQLGEQLQAQLQKQTSLLQELTASKKARSE